MYYISFVDNELLNLRAISSFFLSISSLSFSTVSLSFSTVSLSFPILRLPSQSQLLHYSAYFASHYCQCISTSFFWALLFVYPVFVEFFSFLLVHRFFFLAVHQSYILVLWIRHILLGMSNITLCIFTLFCGNVQFLLDCFHYHLLDRPHQIVLASSLQYRSDSTNLGLIFKPLLSLLLLLSNESVPPGTPTNGVWPCMAKSFFRRTE